MISAARLSAPAVDAEFDRIVAALTRRGLLVGGTSIAALAGLAGCGHDQADATPATSAGARTVSTAHGTVTIPAEPKRIASLDYYVNETLWDLRTTSVVGVPYYQGGPPRYAKDYAALSKTSNRSGLDLEAIAKLDPDLIISLQYPSIDQAYDELAAIAPTVVLPFTTWDANAAAVARVVGREAELDGLRKRFAERAAKIRAAHRDLLARSRFDVLHGGVDQGKFWLIGQQGVITPLLIDAGLRFAHGTASTAGGYQAVSYEKLGTLADADAIIYWSTFGGTTPAMDGPRLFAQQLWQNLPAVKAGRLLPIADFAVGGYGDALAALDELDVGLTRLEKATR